MKLELFGQLFRLPLPLFLLRCAPQKRAPFKSGCNPYHSKIIISSLLFFLTLTIASAQKIVRYDLYVRDTIVTFGDKPKRAIAVNGQIPMPTLTFTEGDIAEIYVHNELKESTSLHWHGLMLPNKEDGVPNLTQMPIEPNTTHKYTFPIIQNGTHCYHYPFLLLLQNDLLNYQDYLDVLVFRVLLFLPPNVFSSVYQGKASVYHYLVSACQGKISLFAI